MRAAPRAHEWSYRRALVVGIALAALLIAAGTLQQVSHSDARHQLEERFTLRVGLGTRFVEAYLSDVAVRERALAETQLTPQTLSRFALRQSAIALGFDVAALLESDGTAIQIVPEQTDLVGSNLAEQYDYLRRATERTVAVSSAVISGAEQKPVLVVATPYDTPYGYRVISGGFLVAESPLASYLRAMMPFGTSDVALVDSAGVIVATNETDNRPTSLTAIERALGELPFSGPTGKFTLGDGERFYAVQDVGGAPLRLVATVDSSTLYSPIEGLGQWLPWIVLSCLALVGLYLLWILGTLSSTQAKLRLATAELERSNRELQDFAGIASHDLQEPLRKIQSFGERLATRSGDAFDAESRDYLARMQDAATRMQSLIQDLLAWSRVRSRSEEPVRVDLNRIATDVVADLETAIEAGSGTVIVEDLPTIDASPLQMRQLFQNLIANGLKFRRDGISPEVRVSSTRLKDTWQLRVSDNGIGFDDKYAERIFAPFERLHGHSAYEGTGMGLAICRRIVERHGGTLTAHGEPGVGATFEIKLPAKAANRRRTRKAKSTKPSKPSS